MGDTPTGLRMTDQRSAAPGHASDRRQAVDFAERMASSEHFTGLFREGMGLLESTANYLDGAGRSDSRELSRLGGLAYATESMKLTTRLMQLASWLLLQRAVNNGEMSPEQAIQEKGKVRLDHSEDREKSAGFDELPDAMKELIAHSLRLQIRIRHLDARLRGEEGKGSMVNPVADQLSRVRTAFGRESAGNG